MNRTLKKLAATIGVIAALTIALGGVGTPSSQALKPIQTIHDNGHFEDLRFCFDDCPWPTSKFGGSGAFVVR